jgi:hypothetical protein
MMVPAWISHSSVNPRQPELQGQRPHFWLRLDRDISATEQVFDVLNGHGVAHPPDDATRSFGFKMGYQWWLQGGVGAWHLVKSVSNGHVLQITLVVDDISGQQK